MSKIQDELKKWAKEAYEFYRPRAEKLHMDFYTQSDLTSISDDKPVELMVIGINPGCGGDFNKDRFNCSDDLLKGNIYDGVHDIQNWKITKDIRAIFDCASPRLGELVDDESTFVLTNATFFSTHDEKFLSTDKEIKAAVKESVEYTKKLIKKIRPQHIICLGGKNCINLIVEETTPLLSNIVKLEYGTFDGIPVYGINHTSYFWTAEQKELVGKSLGKAFAIDSEPIDAISFKSKVQDYINVFEEKLNDRESIKLEPKLRWQYINVCLYNHCKYQLGLEISEEAKDKTWTRFYLKNIDGNNVLVLSVINQAKDKSIGVRYPDQQSTGKDADSILATLQSINAKFKRAQSWIGKLDLCLKDTDTFIVETKALLTNIVKELSGID